MINKFWGSPNYSLEEMDILIESYPVAHSNNIQSLSNVNLISKESVNTVRGNFYGASDAKEFRWYKGEILPSNRQMGSFL